jgi:CBS domain-containing protein
MRGAAPLGHPACVSVQLQHVRVADAMHHGILSCAADAPLGEVAGIMAKHHVHAVAVTDGPMPIKAGAPDRPVAVVSDLDVIAAAASGTEPSALEAAGTEPLTISADQPLHRAAQLMAEHGVAHLVVRDPASGYPVGVLSTLDIAAVYAG